MEKLQSCPICENKAFKISLTCRDFTVSRETFQIVECETCSFKFTNPRPEVDKLGAYYISEEYISHSNTKKGLINSLYQRVRKHTLKKKLGLINRLCSKGDLLDIGCGTGEFLKTCQEGGWNVKGIEPSDQARNMAISNYSLDVVDENKIKEIQAHSFDVISLWHVLEHVPFLNERMEEINSLLKPDGTIIIAVPNCSSDDALYYKEYWAGYDVPRHLYHFTPRDISSLARKHGLSVIDVLPMRFDSFYVSMLSEKYRTNKTNLLRACWRGLLSNIRAYSKGITYSSQIYILQRLEDGLQLKVI
jgi:2-polyprenyl-3-methyl-5-hydroxy-6-metoxy-1,4-benzoquinol methylase